MASTQNSSSKRAPTLTSQNQGSMYTPNTPTRVIYTNNQVGKSLAGFRVARILAVVGVFILVIGIQSSSILLLSLGALVALCSTVMCIVAYSYGASRKTQLTVVGQPYPHVTGGRLLQYNYSAGVGDSSVPYQGVSYPAGYTTTYAPDAQSTSQYNYLPSPLIGDSSDSYQGYNGAATPGIGFSSPYMQPTTSSRLPGDPTDFPPPYDSQNAMPEKN